MNHHVKDYYREYSDGNYERSFFKVIALHQVRDLDWDDIHSQVPALPRGWFELSRLVPRDRIEFTRDYWISKLPYHPNLQEFLVKFFDSVDDIGVFAVQKKFDDPFEVHQVYSLKKDAGFFRGFPPAKESEIVELQNSFPGLIFPRDYIAFLQIHNGFSKTTDTTGLTQAKDVKKSYDQFQEMLQNFDQPITAASGQSIDPKALIPFYESFGMPFYQCFWGEWYPEDEMGNVYFSASEKSISDVNCKDVRCESMAFPTFCDWLMFYLETVG